VRQPREERQVDTAKLKASGKKWGLMGILLLMCVVVYGLYRFLLNVFYIYTLIAYMVIFTALLLSYLIYNRGMSRRGITVDMLPNDWSAEEKQRFVQDGKDRIHRSRWMLLLIVAFLFTFAADFIELYFLPMMQGWISG